MPAPNRSRQFPLSDLPDVGRARHLSTLDVVNLLRVAGAAALRHTASCSGCRRDRDGKARTQTRAEQEACSWCRARAILRRVRQREHDLFVGLGKATRRAQEEQAHPGLLAAPIDRRTTDGYGTAVAREKGEG